MDNRKIRMLDEATVVLSNGATVKIAEGLDGIFNIDITDSCPKDGVRIGIPQGQGGKEGVHYRFWNEIKKSVK